VLVSGPYPTRNVQANLADVAAQVAANRQGANDLLGLIERYGWPVVRQYMEFVQDAAETTVRLALSQLPAGTHSFTDYLETANGASTPICVRFTIHAPSTNTSPPREKNAVAPAATIDFTGTGPVLAGNLNANRAIVTAAVIYTLRLLVNEDIPLNQGVLRAIEILLPICLLNPVAGPTPETTPAVAGGNVETSQRIADVLLGAAGHRGGQPRNDEQRGVRRRVVRILRNHLRRQRRGGRRSGGKRCASAHD
jgi:5-oxoprolinase (ATP-hydrolysing)